MRAHTKINPPNFAMGVLQLAGGSTLAQTITILSAPILSRLYEPSQYGTANILSSIVGILAVVVCLRYDIAITLPEDEGDAVNLYGLSLASSIITSTLCGLLLLATGNYIVKLTNAPDLKSFLWLIPFGIFIQGLYSSGNYWISRHRKFIFVSIARICASLTTSAVPILLALWLGSSSGNLIISWFSGTLVMASIISFTIWRGWSGTPASRFSFQRMFQLLVRYRKFPLIDLWGGLINTLSWQLPALLFSSFFSTEIVGYYSLANRVLILPITLIGGAVSQVFFQHATSIKSDPDRLHHATITIFGRLAGIGLFPSFLLTLAGPELFKIIFSLRWQEAGIYAQILGPWLFFIFISSPLSLVITTLERQELSLVIHITIFISRILALVVGSQTGNPRQALLLWSITGVVIYGGLMFLIFILTRISIREALQHLVKPILLSIPSCALILISRYYNNSILICTLIGISALFYYVAFLRLDKGILDFASRSLKN